MFWTSTTSRKITFVIIMYNVCNMNHLTQPTKWIICIVYDRIHVIFLLVVGVKPFPLYIIWLEADGGCNYHEIRNEVTKPGNVVQMIALTLYKNLFILDLVRFSLLQIQSPKAQKRQLIVTPKKKKNCDKRTCAWSNSPQPFNEPLS